MVPDIHKDIITLGIDHIIIRNAGKKTHPSALDFRSRPCYDEAMKEIYFRKVRNYAKI